MSIEKRFNLSEYIAWYDGFVYFKFYALDERYNFSKKYRKMFKFVQKGHHRRLITPEDAKVLLTDYANFLKKRIERGDIKSTICEIKLREVQRLLLYCEEAIGYNAFKRKEKELRGEEYEYC